MDPSEKRELAQHYLSSLKEHGTVNTVTGDKLELVRLENKYLIAQIAQPQRSFGEARYDGLGYFPLSEDAADLFAQSEVKGGGPSTWFPGSVAVLSTRFSHGVLNLDYLQHCFTLGQPKALDSDFFRQYGGARYRLLETFFDSFPLLDDVSRITLGFHFQQKNGNLSTLLEIVPTHPALQSFQKSPSFQADKCSEYQTTPFLFRENSHRTR